MLFRSDGSDYPDLRDALEKLKLNDAALVYEPETSAALGFGFRVGFLGLLHLEIVRERLEREFDLDLIVTSPNVSFMIRRMNQADYERMDNPARFPHYGDIQSIREPYVDVTIVLPVGFQEAVLNLLKDRRGVHKAIEYLSADRMIIRYEMPLAEIVMDFYDKLKSVSKGYASFDYQEAADRESDLVKLEILVHQDPVDALCEIVHKEKAQLMGRQLCEKLKELIPRQMFDVPIQAAIGGKVIARETVKAKRKDVLAKCYGGDISRKRKLLEKQKKGKKNRMKYVGAIEVPQEAFLSVLSLDGK